MTAHDTLALAVITAVILAVPTLLAYLASRQGDTWDLQTGEHRLDPHREALSRSAPTPNNPKPGTEP